MWTTHSQKLTRTGVILLCMSLCWGCSKQPVYVFPDPPPPHLLEVTPRPLLEMTGPLTNNDLLRMLALYEAALSQCNANKEVLRTYLVRPKTPPVE